MKTNEKKTAMKLNAPNQAKNSRNFLSVPFLIVALAFCIVPNTVFAARERLVLEFDDSHIRGHRGEPATIFLKKSIRRQYPWVEFSDLQLRSVKLVAKSKRGRGGASLRVGRWQTDMYTVGGRPIDFRDRRRITFDRVKFHNPSHNSYGPWQLDLTGNFIVRKVVVEVEDRSWQRRPHRRYNSHHRRW